MYANRTQPPHIKFCFCDHVVEARKIIIWKFGVEIVSTFYLKVSKDVLYFKTYTLWNIFLLNEIYKITICLKTVYLLAKYEEEKIIDEYGRDTCYVKLGR